MRHAYQGCHVWRRCSDYFNRYLMETRDFLQVNVAVFREISLHASKSGCGYIDQLNCLLRAIDGSAIGVLKPVHGILVAWLIFTGKNFGCFVAET